MYISAYKPQQFNFYRSTYVFGVIQLDWISALTAGRDDRAITLNLYLKRISIDEHNIVAFKAI